MLLWSEIIDQLHNWRISDLLALTCRRYIENFLAFGAILFAKMYLHYCTSIEILSLFTQIASTTRVFTLRTSLLLNKNSDSVTNSVK